MLETIKQPKTLPHSEESERAVLAGVLLDPRQLPLISGRLISDDFYFERHRKVYQAMIDLSPEAERSNPKIKPELYGLSQYALPTMFHPQPERVLIVGAGSGNIVIHNA